MGDIENTQYRRLAGCVERIHKESDNRRQTASGGSTKRTCRLEQIDANKRDEGSICRTVVYGINEMRLHFWSEFAKLSSHTSGLLMSMAAQRCLSSAYRLDCFVA